MALPLATRQELSLQLMVRSRSLLLREYLKRLHMLDSKVALVTGASRGGCSNRSWTNKDASMSS